jgi:hypothetical protein
MQNGSNSKILGAFVIGLALVGGAYTIANFTKPEPISQSAAVSINVGEAPPRNPISVVDLDQNGIEDWRDGFVTTKPVIVDGGDDGPYVPPTTLTGQTGINFLQDIISSKLYEGIGRTPEEVINDTVNKLEYETSYKMYDLPDVTVINNYNDEAVKNYFNTMAGVIKGNNLEGYDHELNILNSILNYGETNRLAELAVMSKAYLSMRDGFLATPVPQEFIKQHLDLTNTFFAVGKDIEAMTLAIEDPTVTLLRLRRYEDDVLGMQYALQNMYSAKSQRAHLFNEQDSASLFNSFIPEGRI